MRLLVFSARKADQDKESMQRRNARSCRSRRTAAATVPRAQDRAKRRSVLTRVQHHPDLPGLWPRKNSRKDRATSAARVVLFAARLFH
jgi:hypothetical protein